MSNAEIVGRYNMSEDAQGLAVFIDEQLVAGYAAHGENVSPVMYVWDENSNRVCNARVECETLTDGSKVLNLYLVVEK